MASDALFLALSEALSKPSKAYRAAEAGLRGIGQGIEGYLSGKKIRNQLDDQELGRKTLADVFGPNIPDGVKGFENLRVREAERLGSPLRAIADFKDKKKDEPTMVPLVDRKTGKTIGQVPSNAVFGGESGSDKPPAFVSTEDGMAVLYDADNPDPTKKFSRVPFPWRTSGETGGLGPKIAPTLPAGEAAHSATLRDLLGDLQKIRDNYKPEYVGFYDSNKAKAKQLIDGKASIDAAEFLQSVANYKNKVFQLASGGAIPADEAKRLAEAAPTLNRSDVDFLSRVGNSESIISGQLTNREREFQRAGYSGQAGAALPGNSQTGDPQADNAINIIMGSNLSDAEKMNRVNAVRVRARYRKP